MSLCLMGMLLSLQLAGKTSEGSVSCENVNGNSARDFNTLVESASKVVKTLTQEAAGKPTNMQVSVCIQSSVPVNSDIEHPSSSGGADVRPENEWTEKKTTLVSQAEVTSQATMRDCSSLQRSGITKSGVYSVWPKFLDHPLIVYCDMENNGGGWTVIQRRGDFEPHINFFETWKKYREGFGDLNKEFWLGNDAIFALTNQEHNRLRVDLEDFDGNKTYAEYGKFLIRGEVEKYRIIVENYEGEAGDALTAHNGVDFSTKDKAVNKCASRFKGGWWYKSCHSANLNGLYLHGDHESYADGVNWKQFRGYHHSLKTTEMKIRPANR